ncbi:flagellar hook-length control protein FliK [Aneurinibacillus sp. Ricciae_BoGa-3]|uniref:flagellar hook-length control protein FliK n=1 Tax=Aneurinibacillus sp. Ricciae_BoGa-3 TaxID=3022697 RepID=UPI00234286AC|nr:flagellar hook-length control protein FliK [Aneurinibacillus sp. Ricciae_BoGa-3]WCK52895.1 flagellar hook-length control protein FliK [Aneurinibacillus sp. Ricciae_BoGa-3]
MPIMQVNGNMQSLNSSQKPATKEAEKKGGFADILGSAMQNVSQDSQDLKSNNGENVNLDAQKIELKDMQKLLLSLEQLIGKSKEKEVPGSVMDENQLMMALQQLYQMIQPSNAVPAETASNQAAGSSSLLQLLPNTPQQTTNLLAQDLVKMFAVMQAQGKDGLNSGLNSEIAQVVKGLSDLIKGMKADESVIPETENATINNEATNLAPGASVDVGIKPNASASTASNTPLPQNLSDFTGQKAANKSAGVNTANPIVNRTKQAEGEQAAQITVTQNQADQFSDPSAVNSDEGTSVKGKQTTQITDSSDTQKVVYHQLQNPLSADSNNGAQLKKADLPLVPSRFFVKEMEVVISNQVRINNGTGAYETTLRLFPENLGRVDVKISALNGQITAQFLTSSAAGKEVVESQLDQLKNTLVNQGLEVSKLEVVQNPVTPSDSSNNQSNGNLGDQQKNQSHQQESNKKDEQPAKNFFDDLRHAAGEGEQPDDPIELDGVDMTA